MQIRMFILFNSTGNKGYIALHFSLDKMSWRLAYILTQRSSSFFLAYALCIIVWLYHRLFSLPGNFLKKIFVPGPSRRPAESKSTGQSDCHPVKPADWFWGITILGYPVWISLFPAEFFTEARKQRSYFLGRAWLIGSTYFYCLIYRTFSEKKIIPLDFYQDKVTYWFAPNHTQLKWFSANLIFSSVLHNSPQHFCFP